MANMANSGSAGGANASSTSAGWLFPDRVNLPFVTTPDTGPGATSPPKTLGHLPVVPISRFPDRNWSTEWFAWLALAEFAGTDWRTGLRDNIGASWPGAALKDVPTLIGLLPPNDPPVPPMVVNWTPLTLDIELNDLVTAAENERADALGEILSQSDEFISYFLNAMSARPASHPKTTQVLAIASLVATLAAMYLKGLYARPRPSQLCPALLPPIEVPGHSSFPSGHSTQAHLMALCMADVLAGPPPPAPPPPSRATTMETLATLADRIARNREIAGLHYATDSLAGKAVAAAVHTLLSADVPVGQNLLPPDPSNNLRSCYLRAVAGAQKEWP
ncbi:MAG TPA: phosphatase PAP2 family protein [Acetobacteraceae bacterium]